MERRVWSGGYDVIFNVLARSRSLVLLLCRVLELGICPSLVQTRVITTWNIIHSFNSASQSRKGAAI